MCVCFVVCQYVLYQITSLGYVNESAMAYADGIYESIAMAHNNLQNGTIKWWVPGLSTTLPRVVNHPLCVYAAVVHVRAFLRAPPAGTGAS